MIPTATKHQISDTNKYIYTMSKEVRNQSPEPLWNHFSDLNEVPRPSKKEERVIEFAKRFGESLGLETIVDEVGNVIIRKPAFPGMENRLPVVLQSHLDMVHQKNNNTDFDFESEGIRMYIDGDWVKAEGTTLGADNGIGVAAIMAVLASDNLPHPPLEALFTIDEETGMTGAKGLKGGILNGKILLNLDTEDDDEVTIGCAGGVDVTANGTYNAIEVPAGHTALEITVNGLTGGHSGMDIHLGRGNANKIVNRILRVISAETDLYIASIDGGGLRNAIPREAVVKVLIPESSRSKITGVIQELYNDIKAEYQITDPDIRVAATSADYTGKVTSKEFAGSIIAAIGSAINGIYRMSPSVEGLVQSSNNVARVELGNGTYTIKCLTRSSVNSERDELAGTLKAGFELIGASVGTDGDYPGWEPKPDSNAVKIVKEQYEKLFNEAPHVSAVHAGLECGILGTNYPEMEMVSFGPNIRGAHSPDEKVQISSVQKFWELYLEVLKNIPEG